MPKCALANENGFLALVDTSVESCTGVIVITASDYEYLMGFTQVSAIEATAVFSGAFSLVFVSGFAMSYAIKMAIKLVKIL
ncbi:single-stranded DNA-binding protein [Vibrio sp. Sgm 22]|uniref:single-stranded DNA-binding protein n=1 Tax=unclassified Vibrio TaxID=2614977 RepID=UPI002058AD34|nr:MULTISPECIES: single-stranded DNA-binding protein [unclassified Vibrio]MCX2759902.1 single-stranded DNA-binding protein [Vibrio sp. 14G-20]MCX2776889.1 single-stranded DNA-binding protein [Vibrio sp. Sgm 22]UPR56749.1 single-stranded DNA-binding protein [Vibrio sp. ED004]